MCGYFSFCRYRWPLQMVAASTSCVNIAGAPPLAPIHRRTEKNISLQNPAVLLAQCSPLENLERPRVFFQCPLAARLNRSSEQRRKPKHRPLHQAHSNPLSSLFAVLGRSPVYSHPPARVLQLFIRFDFIGAKKQRD